MKKLIKGAVKSLGNSTRGLKLLVKTQPNSKIHMWATLAIVVLGLILGFERWDWVLLFLAIGMVWVAKAGNTALEMVADRLRPRKDAKINAAKELGASAVLVATLVAVLVGLSVLYPYIYDLFAFIRLKIVGHP